MVAALFPKVLRGETSSSRREAVEAVVEAGPDGGATHRGQLGACIGYLVDQVELAAVGLIGVGVGLCDEPGGASRIAGLVVKDPRGRTRQSFPLGLRPLYRVLDGRQLRLGAWSVPVGKLPVGEPVMVAFRG